MIINWPKLGVTLGALAALGAILGQLDSCLTERVTAAVSVQAASHADVERLEAKIDQIYDFLLTRKGR